MGDIEAVWKYFGGKVPDTHARLFGYLLAQFGDRAKFKITDHIYLTLLDKRFRIPLDEKPEPEIEWPGIFMEIQGKAEGHWAKQKFGPSAGDYLEVLSCSRKILEGLQANPGGRKRPKKGQGKKENQLKALGLLRRCSESGFPAPIELVDALEVCAGQNSKQPLASVSRDQKKAIRFELDGNWKLHLGEGWFTDTSSDAVATHLGHSDAGRTIRNWRRTPVYKQAFLDGFLGTSGNKK
jgi:hypothetical protein